MNIHLRPWETSDAKILATLANDSAIAANLTDAFPYPYTLENAYAFIDMTQKQNPTLIFAITDNHVVVGGIGLHPQSDIFKKNAELGYWLGKKFWGKGIMPIAIQLIVEYGFSTLPIERIYARPFGSNIASQRVLEKSGFSLEATLKKTIYKNKSYQDELIYAIRKSELIF